MDGGVALNALTQDAHSTVRSDWHLVHPASVIATEKKKIGPFLPQPPGHAQDQGQAFSLPLPPFPSLLVLPAAAVPQFSPGTINFPSLRAGPLSMRKAAPPPTSCTAV